jgi:pimeloyl-ACP methyl ester carboxylesterase
MDRSPFQLILIKLKSSLFAGVLIGSIASANVLPVESYVEAKGPTGPLKGTMLAPVAGHGPVVIIIPGSGPTDRDGNNPLGIKASTYRLLAEGLVAHGVSTVRIDKRGMFASAAATPDANAVTIADYVDDVRSWVSAIRQRTGTPCVWLLGHSEGGLIALAAAQQQSDLCGLILVATPGRPMGEILREQLKANPANAPLLNSAMQAIDKLEAGKYVDTTAMDPALVPLFSPPVQGFLIDAFAYDPARLISRVQKPVLILQGRRDLQVSEADAQLLKKMDPAADLVLLPNVNHVLKAVSSDAPGANAAAYADPSLPLGPGVLDSIAAFLNAYGRENS